jgi:predicted MPP superfamily phosphohydrolase
MSFFLLIIGGLPVLDLLWWRWADLRLRRLSHAGRWRLLLAAFAGGNLAVYGWLLLSRWSASSFAVPQTMLGAAYIWHLVVLPATMLLLAGGGVLQATSGGSARLWQIARRRRTPAVIAETARETADPSPTAPAPTLTRRQMLAAVAVAVPPVATVAAQVRALTQLGGFRIRHLEVELPTLPAALDGLTIAHVSDVHVGRFTHGAILDEIVSRTNALHPDLVLFTGDLIDYALADLPAGLDMLRRLAPPERLFACEGNHDLFEGREEFERRVRSAGVRLLLDEAATLEVRGQKLQILGLRWGQPGTRHGASFDEHMQRVLPLRQPAAFPILLAHHPHAFDQAAEAGVPLTLAGHTHGGQLMLTSSIGAGPALFKYWSGLYRRRGSALVVSNGVGNWFPLRINAPAEILHLTLRTGRRA